MENEELIRRQDNRMRLPDLAGAQKLSFEWILSQRRSVRKFAAKTISMDHLSRLLFAAQGINRPPIYRTAPSAGALYPLEVYLVSGLVTDLPAGVYRYIPRTHSLFLSVAGDCRVDMVRSALNQSWMAAAPVIFVLCAVYDRVTSKYGERGLPYVHMEAGSAAQNVCLQAVAMGMGTTQVGAFIDRDMQKILNADQDHMPLLVLPVGFPG